MRTFSTGYVGLITAEGRKMNAELKVYNNRSFFSSLTANNPPANAYGENATNFHPQDTAYDATAGWVTAIVYGEHVCLLYDGDTTVYIPTTSGASESMLPLVGTRPAIYLSSSNSRIYYSTNSSIRCANLSISNIRNKTMNGAISSFTTVDSSPAGSVHLINSYDKLAVVYYDSGTIRSCYTYYSGGWQNRASSQRLFHASAHLGMVPFGDVASGLDTARSAAVWDGTDCWVYITSPEDGSVYGNMFDVSANTWSDLWVAIPSDLCTFDLVNGFYANGKYWVGARFKRNEEIATPWTPILTYSEDGKYFSVDQFMAISSKKYRFTTKISGNYIQALDSNRRGQAATNYSMGSTGYASYPAVELALSETNNATSDLDIKVEAGDESVFDDTLFKKGNLGVLSVGYMSSTGGYDYEDYGEYIISQLDYELADGVRSAYVRLAHEGLWKLQTQVAPYYTEILGKSALFDEVRDYEHLSAAPGLYEKETSVTIDFWGAEPWSDFYSGTALGINILEKGAPKVVLQNNDFDVGFRSQEIKVNASLVENPVINSTDTITISIYGWCRSGSTGYPNASIWPNVYVDRGGTDVRLVGTMTSSYNEWPRTYPAAASGSYPITFTLNDFEIGDKIAYVAIRVKNDSTSGGNYFCIERVTISGTGLAVTRTAGTLAWHMDESDDEEKFDAHFESETGGELGLYLPGDGIARIMFASEPWSAFNFRIGGVFALDKGDNYSTGGATSFGLVGLAESAEDCIVARYEIKSQYWQLWKIRNKIATKLTDASDTTAVSPYTRMIFEHKDGVFNIYRSHSATIQKTPILSYTWNVSTQGPIATTTRDMLHVGIYGMKRPYSFRTTSFNVAKGDGIPVLPDDLGDFNSFPSSGLVVLDNVVYEYTSKIAAASFSPVTTGRCGPYQMRSIMTYNNYSNPTSTGSHTFPATTAVDMSYFDYDNAASVIAGKLVASDVGYSWLISETDWRPPDGAGSLLLNRSRHFADIESANILGLSNRMYLTHGLAGITRRVDISLDKGEEEEEVEGVSPEHLRGTRCYLYTTEKVRCVRFFGANADDVMTVRDMLSKVCAAAGVVSYFPGDSTWASIGLTSGSEEILRSG